MPLDNPGIVDGLETILAGCSNPECEVCSAIRPAKSAIEMLLSALERAQGTLASSRHLLTKYCPDHHWLPEHDQRIEEIKATLHQVRQPT